MAKKKVITMDELAGMVQRGFDDIRGQMATKKDLEAFATKKDLEAFATKRDLLETKAELVRAIKDLEMHLSSSSLYSQEKIDSLRSWMENIDTRVAALEAGRGKK